MAQQVKDLALSLQRLGSLQWGGFDPWSRNFCRPWVWPKKNCSDSRIKDTQQVALGKMHSLSEPRLPH